MRAWLVCSFVVLSIVGCGNRTEDAPHANVSSNAPADTLQSKPNAKAPPVKDHYYSMRDGKEYGYESELSQQDKSKGIGANSLTMVRYAGSRGDKFQAFSYKNGTYSVLECQIPCEYVKVMTFSNGEHIQTERMKVSEGIIGWSIMQDAIDGKLEQSIHISQDKKKRSTLWFSEENGIELIPYEP